jgi:phosphatidylglycerophosphatase A
VPWVARRDGSWPLGLLVATAIAALAIWSAGRAEIVFGGKDHSRIVIDEVAGMTTAALFVPRRGSPRASCS